MTENRGGLMTVLNAPMRTGDMEIEKEVMGTEREAMEIEAMGTDTVETEAMIGNAVIDIG